eukprot:5856340-Pleurochrysis_carterae.AAC.1
MGASGKVPLKTRHLPNGPKHARGVTCHVYVVHLRLGRCVLAPVRSSVFCELRVHEGMLATALDQLSGFGSSLQYIFRARRSCQV